MCSNQATVWGNTTWGTNIVNRACSFGSGRSFGPFGSFSSHRLASGPSSLPNMWLVSLDTSKNTLATNSQNNNTMVTIGAESKSCSWSSRMEKTSGGSSRTSSPSGSLDWSATVDGVFQEEIQKLAEENRNVWR